ncbi:hypothetical protein Pint_10468 [Pistacia integerrima]|uniref:Uncharacterized protein n=1 Tax=Pistacia integerrima TaxID=434235 RepID=A0ACC0XGE7_9ROSI|nr:hypothetical protein Pint_10468 [Pistacia integerrima]
MVSGLPQLKAPSKLCKDCSVGKQQRDPFSKKNTWRASKILQIVRADICGPIRPISNSKKRKNKTIMNAVHSMLSEKKIPRTFWPEAVNWNVHVLNRIPTYAVRNKLHKKLGVELNHQLITFESLDVSLMFMYLIIKEQSNEEEATKVADNEEENEANFNIDTKEDVENSSSNDLTRESSSTQMKEETERLLI